MKKDEKLKNKMTLPATLSIDEEYPISYNFDLKKNIIFLKKIVKESKNKNRYEAGAEAETIHYLGIEYEKKMREKPISNGQLTNNFKKWLIANYYEDIIVWFNETEEEMKKDESKYYENGGIF